MKRVLVLVPGYLPGFKSGGPARTVANMVDALGDELSFSIVCLNRDLGDNEPYTSINKKDWNQQGKAKVFYIERGPRGLFKLMSIMRSVEFDVIHLNGFLSFQFSILPILMHKIFGLKVPIIIGARGEFSKGALAFKSTKKRLFISFVKAIDLYRYVIWHASSTYEAEDIRRVMGPLLNIRVAIDIAQSQTDLQLARRDVNRPLRVAFISRICPKKNLDGALEILSSLTQPVNFDVYGPREDEAYWQICLQAINKLPANVHFNYLGALSPDVVSKTLADYDLFLFPTLGENFGHVIAEALFTGLPVLISDQTPWRQLSENNIGWDISLQDKAAFVAAIESCCRKTGDEYAIWRQSIRRWALENIGNQAAIDATRQLFKGK
jgi:glycosyltransferase involved in cell wall biosynthesis